jgi:hypothetical protein
MYLALFVACLTALYDLWLMNNEFKGALAGTKTCGSPTSLA